MTRHRYPPSALFADYARAALGLAVTLPPLVLVGLAPVAVAIFSGLALLFALFGASTLLRQLGTLVIDDSGIAIAGGWSRRIDWAALTRLRLRWFAARRDRRAGYMQLVLKGGGRRIAIDSSIEDFTAIAAAAARVAAARGLALDDNTIANLAAMGVEPIKSSQLSVLSSQSEDKLTTDN
jgi:hypothetical protein